MSYFKQWRKDLIAIGVLCVLWLVFFGHMLTPNFNERSSFKQGDFSGQFVAFGAYQYARWVQGEVPLWNPYNNSGMPFIADPQAAVFYPPRLLTIALASLSGGWSYRTLELEAMLHVLAFSLAFYAMLRAMTAHYKGASEVSSAIGAVIAAYSGWTSGYPPLQLAILEAAAWSPLVIMGVYLTTRSAALRWGWLYFAGMMLGCSWLAGHPQTSWFITYLAVAYFSFRGWRARATWTRGALALGMFGAVTLGATAVTLLPGLEYLPQTGRAELLTFADKAGGFPLHDVVQFWLPYTTTVFAPLYVGLGAVMLISFHNGESIRKDNNYFWMVVGIVALLLSFGGNTPVYSVLYHVLPGLSYFRGQERAAFVVMFSMATLVSHTLCYWHHHNKLDTSCLSLIVSLLVVLLGFTSGILWVVGLIEAQLATVLLTVFIFAIGYLVNLFYNQKHYVMLNSLFWFGGLITLELFTFNRQLEAVYDPFPAEKQPAPYAQDLLDIVRADNNQPFRVDGFRGLRDNYGSQLEIMDMRGISPLFLTSAQKLIYQHYINNPRAWEVFAVRYVLSEREQYITTTTERLAASEDRDGVVYLHKLVDPRPYAHFVYAADVVDSDEFALALLNDPNYRPRDKVILQQQPTLTLPEAAPEGARAEFVSYAPEKLVLSLETPENGILTLAHVDYIGWQARLDGANIPILRAYGVTMALEIPAGSHTLELVYDPLSYQVGLGLSLITWAGAGIWLVYALWRRRTKQV